MGQVTVLVPSGWAEPSQDEGYDGSHDMSRHITVFETALAAVREAKDGEIAALRDQLRALQAANDGQISLLREELCQERGRIAELIAQIGDLETRLHHETRVAKEALEVADQLRQAEAERQGRGRWRRLRAAWRGE